MLGDSSELSQPPVADRFDIAGGVELQHQPVVLAFARWC